MYLGRGEKSRRGLGGFSRDFAEVGKLTENCAAKRSWDGTGMFRRYWERGLQPKGKYQRDADGSEETRLGTWNKKD